VSHIVNPAASNPGTVTSVAGGVGITNTPEPITGAGTVDLDINSLTSETALAAGDLFPFLDVSISLAPSSQRKVTHANLEASLSLNNLLGTLSPAKGGTGLSSVTANSVLSGNVAGTAIEYRSLTTLTPASLAITPGAGIFGFSLDADLDAFATLGTTGLVVRGGAGSFATRSIAVSGGLLTIANGDGISANPTVGLLNSAIDHGALSGLADDDHAQYLRLAGRTGTTNDPTLSTSTTGSITGSSGGAANHLDLFANTTALAPANAGRVRPRERIKFTDNWTFTANYTGDGLIDGRPTVTITGAGLVAFPGFFYQPTIVYNTSQALSQCPAFNGAPVYRTSATGLNDLLTVFGGYISSPQYQQNAGAGSTGTTAHLSGYFSELTASRTSTGTGTVTRAAHHWMAAGSIGAGITVTDFNGLFLTNPSNAGTITTLTGVEIAALTSGGTNLSLRSAGTGVAMRHAGSAVFGANAAPTNASVGLELSSTTKALLVSRMTTAQRDALTATNGMIIYNTTTNTFQGRAGGAWGAV